MASPPSLACPPVTSATPAVTVPRKRRRRAPATGAADDCFACRKKQVKCDRRRPYCTPCLDHGKECSGYKTQLTWGVGVASRGKLRGQSLPIAKKTNTSPTITALRGRGSSSTDEGLKSPSNAKERVGRGKANITRPSPVVNNVMTYDFVNMDPTGSPVIPALHSSSFTCAASIPSEHADGMRISMEPSHAYPLLRQSFLSGYDMSYDTPLASPLTEEFGISPSGSSIVGFGSDFGDSDVSSPIDLPQTPEDFSLQSNPFSFYQAPPYQTANCIAPPMYAPINRRPPTSFPDHYSTASSMSSSLSSDRSIYESGVEHAHAAEPIGPCNLSDVVFDDGVIGGNAPNASDIELGFGFVHLLTPRQASTNAILNQLQDHPT